MQIQHLHLVDMGWCNIPHAFCYIPKIEHVVRTR